MSLCAALKSLIAFVSTATCYGASPAPRQQYQRTTVTPGATDCGATMTGVGAGVTDGSADVDASSLGGTTVAGTTEAVAC